MHSVHSFPPIVGDQPHTLILGSMPGQASLDAGQYYAHPRNAFWPIVSALFGFDSGLSYEQRCVCLSAAGIAVWDSLQVCVRPGSLDSAIQADTEIANDFAGLLQQHPTIQRIFFNGAKAESVFKKHVMPTLHSSSLSFMRLPSTSPAHAVLSFEDKLQQWRVIA